MSFTFNWPRFSDQFHQDAIQMLNTALNKGNKPPVIADKIEVVELEMGTQPPELEIRDIGDMTMDQFRGIFRLTYTGDAHIVLKTKVQANPLNHKQPDIDLMTGSRGMLAAKQPLVVPMLLRLSHFKLNSYVVLVVSKQKGITVVFKTDPLQNVDINSTFDSIAVIQMFIQREIEGQLRQMFREDLPGIIHRLSQQWVKAKVEAPYLSNRPPPSRSQSLDTRSHPDLSFHTPSVSALGLQPHFLRQSSLGPLGYRRARSVSGVSAASGSHRSSTHPMPSPLSAPAAPPLETSTSLPDLENYDPTYGLRPEGLPNKSLFRGFSNLFVPNKGLADLAEEVDEGTEYEGDGGSYDVVDWVDTIPDMHSSTTGPFSDSGRDAGDFETIPAVGGGTITRPRVYHSHSQISPPPELVASTSQTPLKSSRTAEAYFDGHHSPLYRPGLVRSSSTLSTGARRANSSYNPYFPDYTRSHSHSASEYHFPIPTYPQSAPVHRHPSHQRSITPDSLETQRSQSSSNITQSIATPPSTDPKYADDAIPRVKHPTFITSERRLSISSSSDYDAFNLGSPKHNNYDPDAKIILRPSLNNSISKLSTLSYSNHTLSPYTRDVEHFTVRSVPPRAPGSSGSPAGERQPVKAKRKRMYRLGGRPKDGEVKTSCTRTPPSPVPPSEFDAEDMDRYFCSQEELSGSPEPHHTHAHQAWP